MIVGYLKVMLGGDGLGISNPVTDDVRREIFGQLGLTRRPQVVEQFRPRLQAGSLDDSQQLRAKVGVCLAVSRNDEGLALLGRIPRLF
ncbi:MAG: hypothetical protein KDA61_09900 [Planctomycetales bacterium]|nr:hypothetical protein [Planctomycetales bacterium]